jgi:hypothetical protein
LFRSVIPFFIGTNDDVEVELVAVCHNENAEEYLAIFKNEDQMYDLTGLSARHRIRALYDLAQEGGQKDPLLAVYRSAQDPKLRVVGDFEFASETEWTGFLRSKQRDDGFHVFKALIRLVHRPDCRKLYQEVDRLTDRSLEDAEEVVSQLDQLVAAGVLVDITAEIA